MLTPITPRVKIIVININPIVFGSFKKRTLKYPKSAAKKTRMVIMRYESIYNLGQKLITDINIKETNERKEPLCGFRS